MKIGPLVTKFCHLALGGPVIMTGRVYCAFCALITAQLTFLPQRSRRDRCSSGTVVLVAAAVVVVV